MRTQQYRNYYHNANDKEVNKFMRKTNVINFENFRQYEPIDLESCFDITEEPPEEMLEQWRRERDAWNPFHGMFLRKIGNTWYQITTDCDGMESLSGKVRRLMFSEPLLRVEAI